MPHPHRVEMWFMKQPANYPAQSQEIIRVVASIYVFVSVLLLGFAKYSKKSFETQAEYTPIKMIDLVLYYLSSHPTLSQLEMGNVIWCHTMASNGISQTIHLKGHSKWLDVQNGCTFSGRSFLTFCEPCQTLPGLTSHTGRGVRV